MEILSHPLFIQAVLSGLIFIGLWLVLSKIFFAPYLALLIEREERTVGDEKAAVSKLAQSGKILEEIEDALRQVRVECITARDEEVGKARQEGQKIILAASERAQQKLQKARDEIEQLYQAAQAEIGSESQKLAGEVVERMLSAGGAHTVH